MGSQVKIAGDGASGGGGGFAWTSPENITADDSFAAQVYLGSTDESEYLTADNFGFTVPTGATINGIVAIFFRYAMGTVEDVSVSLYTSSGDVGDAFSGNTWASMETADVFGSETEDWNTSLSPADVNSSLFGVKMKCTAPFGGMALVNYVEMQIHYTESGGSSAGLPQVVTMRSRAAPLARPRTSAVFAPPLFVSAPAASPSYFPLVVFPGNAPAISRRQATARVAGIAIVSPIAADPPAAVPTLPTVVVLGGLQSRLTRVAPRSQIVTVPSADPDPSPPPR